MMIDSPKLEYPRQRWYAHINPYSISVREFSKDSMPDPTPLKVWTTDKSNIPSEEMFWRQYMNHRTQCDTAGCA